MLLVIIFRFRFYLSLNVAESEISLSRFLCILENLDVSIEEIYGILSKDNPTRTEELLARVSKAFQQNNIPALKNIIMKK